VAATAAKLSPFLGTTACPKGAFAVADDREAAEALVLLEEGQALVRLHEVVEQDVPSSAQEVGFARARLS
jgi:hypothetical protein